MDIVDLARDLVRRRSVTPDDAGCQAVIAKVLVLMALLIYAESAVLRFF